MASAASTNFDPAAAHAEKYIDSYPATCKETVLTATLLVLSLMFLAPRPQSINHEGQLR
jgi:hypothetical protein